MDIFSKSKVAQPSSFSVQPCELVVVTGFYIDEQECLYVPDYDCDVGVPDCKNDCGLPDGVEFQLQYRVEADCGDGRCWIPFRPNGAEVMLSNENNPVFIDGDLTPGTFRFFPTVPLGDITIGLKSDRFRKCR